MSETTDRLQLGLAAEHAAIYAYGVIGAHLSDEEQTLAHTAESDHRTQRDTVADLITAGGATPAAAAAAYRLPEPVSDRSGALALAVEIETRVAAVWRAALAVVDEHARENALNGLVGAGVRAAEWRRASNSAASPVVPWPGR